MPGAGFHWLTPLYDLLVALTCRDDTMKGRLVAAANLRPGHRVLDLGCGTGNLALRVKRSRPGVEVCGIDTDPRILSDATAKAKRVGNEVAFTRGFAESLPFPDASFDRIVSSLFFHHLLLPQKAAALREAARRVYFFDCSSSAFACSTGGRTRGRTLWMNSRASKRQTGSRMLGSGSGSRPCSERWSLSRLDGTDPFLVCALTPRFRLRPVYPPRVFLTYTPWGYMMRSNRARRERR